MAPSTMFVNVVTTAANARPMMNATAISTRLPFAMKSRNSFSMTASLRRCPRGGYPNSDALDGLQLAGVDSVDECLEVLVVLIRVALREVGDRPVEAVALAEICGDGDGIAGARMRPRQRPPACLRVERQIRGRHGLDD